MKLPELTSNATLLKLATLLSKKGHMTTVSGQPGHPMFVKVILSRRTGSRQLDSLVCCQPADVVVPWLTSQLTFLASFQ